MDHRGKCFCPTCQSSLDGQLVIDEHVWLVRHCPLHGYVRTLMFDSPGYFVRALEISNAPAAMPRHRCLVAEVTQKCDVGCITCSACSTIAGFEPSAEELTEAILEEAAVLGADTVALSGGEPLMRSDLWEIMDAVHLKVGRIVLITSGRNFETDPTILAEIAARSAWLEIYLQFDSLRDDMLRALRTPWMTAELRKTRLGLAIDTGAATSAVCVVAPDTTPQEIGELASYCRGAGAQGITYQPLRQLGRYPRAATAANQMSAVDHIQACALRALGVNAPDPQPLVQQPFDISVAFVTGSAVKPVAGFFTGKGRGQAFRVATSSYWDFTNFFLPFAEAGPHYFFIRSGRPLNAHYFKAALDPVKAPEAAAG